MVCFPLLKACFLQAFRRSKSGQSSVSIASSPVSEIISHELTFEITLEIREEDGKGHTAVPKDKKYFKIRSSLGKQIIITVLQTNDALELPIERCFGLLVSSGKNVKNSDMHLLEMVSMGTTNSTNEKKTAYSISGNWDPSEPVFAPLNKETTKDVHSVDMTVAVDLVIRVYLLMYPIIF